MTRLYRSIAVAVIAVLALGAPSFAAQAKTAKAKTLSITGTLLHLAGCPQHLAFFICDSRLFAICDS